MQAITALAHINAAVLYFIDLSETCGYSIEQQVSLFKSFKPLFSNKPLVLVMTKSDLVIFLFFCLCFKIFSVCCAAQAG